MHCSVSISLTAISRRRRYRGRARLMPPFILALQQSLQPGRFTGFRERLLVIAPVRLASIATLVMDCATELPKA